MHESIVPKHPAGSLEYFLELARFHKTELKKQQDLLLSENKKYAECLAEPVRLARDMQLFEMKINHVEKEIEFHEKVFKSNAISFTNKLIDYSDNCRRKGSKKVKIN